MDGRGLETQSQQSVTSLGRTANPSGSKETGKQADQGSIEKIGNMNQMAGSQETEESEDEGLKFEDLLSPGGQNVNFGSFKQHEIRKIWNMRIAENKSTAINEYGSNLFKSKFDPLAAIEAKAALMSQTTAMEHSSRKDLAHEEIKMAGKSDLQAQVPSSPLGTQEAPEVEWSSQETTILKSTEENMEEIKMGEVMELVKPADKEKIEEGQINKMSPAGNNFEIDCPHEIHTENNFGKMEARRMKEPADPREEKMDRRHNERVQNQGTGDLNISDKAEALKDKKNMPGNSHPHTQNSFAVLSNDALISISNKMGVNTSSLSFEHFDILRDLENARSNIESRNEEKDTNEKDTDNFLPLVEIKLIAWESEESDEEGFKPVMSNKKKESWQKGQSIQDLCTPT